MRHLKNGRKFKRDNNQRKAFLKTILGSLITVGLGEKSPDWVQQILDGGDRKLAGVMAESLSLIHI